MDRKDFLKFGTFTSAATVIGANNAFSQNLTNNKISI